MKESLAGFLTSGFCYAGNGIGDKRDYYGQISMLKLIHFLIHRLDSVHQVINWQLSISRKFCEMKIFDYHTCIRMLIDKICNFVVILLIFKLRILPSYTLDFF